MIRPLIVAGLLLVLLQGRPAYADPAATRPAGVDLQRREWQIPVEGRPTVVIFLSPGQKQSESEIAQVRQNLQQAKQIAVLGVISGPDAAKRAQAVGQWDWPLLADDTFTLSGAFEVHAWPTTIIFDAAGNMVGRIAGNPASLKGSLTAYVAYVSGAITREKLEEELKSQRIVEDSNEQRAMRHLLLVQQLYASGRRDDAAEQLKQAQDLAPGTEPVRMLMARDMLLLGDAKGADTVLKTLDDARRPAELALLRGWSAVAQGRWEEARDRLGDAQRLPLEPAAQVECQYWLGVVYQHDKGFAQAAEAFRRAYELSIALPAGGRRVSPGQ